MSAARPREVRRRAYADPPEVLITSYELLRIDEREIAELAPDPSSWSRPAQVSSKEVILAGTKAT